jgi:hypothetical protein
VNNTYIISNTTQNIVNNTYYITQDISNTVNDTNIIVKEINTSLQANMTYLINLVNGLNISNQEKLDFILSNVSSISDYLEYTNQTHTEFMQNIISNVTYWLPKINSNQTYWFPIINTNIDEIPTSSGGSTSKVIVTTEDTTCERLFPNRETCLYWDGTKCTEGCSAKYTCDSNLVCQYLIETEYEKNWFNLKEGVKEILGGYESFSNKNLDNQILTVNYFIKPIYILPIIMVLILTIIAGIYYSRKKYDFEYEE